jgi:hypothetical protein
MLGRVRTVTCDLACLQELFSIFHPCDEAAGPLKNGLLLFVRQICVLHRDQVVGGYLCHVKTTLRLSTPQDLLRLPNMQADLSQYFFLTI